MQLGPLQADMDIQEHREQVSYGRVLMFFRRNVKLDNDETKEVELAYILKSTGSTRRTTGTVW